MTSEVFLGHGLSNRAHAKKEPMEKGRGQEDTGTSVSQASSLKPGIHMPFVYMTMLWLRSQTNFAPIKDLTGQIQVYDLNISLL